MVGWVSSKLPIVRKAGQFQSAVDSDPRFRTPRAPMGPVSWAGSVAFLFSSSFENCARRHVDGAFRVTKPVKCKREATYRIAGSGY
jgi:hypothetical protein